MAETPYLVNSNVLLRWVKPNHRDYPVIVSATDAISRHDGVLCYTSQNVGEFWNACTRPVDRNGYGLSPHDLSGIKSSLPTGIQVEHTPVLLVVKRRRQEERHRSWRTQEFN